MNTSQTSTSWWSSLKSSAQHLLNLAPLISTNYLYPSTTSPIHPCTNASLTPFIPKLATITHLSLITPNSTFHQPSPPFPDPIEDLPLLCAITINIPTSTSSSINIGIFLPSTWNLRLLAVGNGGFGGGINFPDMSSHVHQDFATFSTDTGHTSPVFDGSWALHNPEAVTDWGWRALHMSTVMVKRLVREYYGMESRWNYYSGCSTGGRQGLKAIQAFPRDFDGVVVGAPAWWTSRLQPWHLRVSLWILPTSGKHHIKSEDWEWIAEEVMKQCDGQDGVVDGVISDPEGCHFVREKLLCTPVTQKGGRCLSREQLGTYEKIISDWRETGSELMFPSHTYGSEVEFGSFMGVVDKGIGHPMGTTWLENFFLNHTEGVELSSDEWESVLNISTVHLGDALNPGSANADNFDLQAFEKRGGKVLHWHGYADGLIPWKASLYFWSQVQKMLIPRGVDVESFYRLFLVPGLMHCKGGIGHAPWWFNGAGQGRSVDGPAAPRLDEAIGDRVVDETGLSVVQESACGSEKYDVVKAMMKWVEEGVAPDSIVATKLESDEGENVVHRRPVCRYPKVAKWGGVGDLHLESSWACKDLY